MNPDEYINFENRYYQNPTLTRDETLSFVDSLRDTVQKDNASIAKQTQSLGTDVQSNLGGLTGSQGYFAQRYQTTPVENQVNTLKAVAQADAMNKLMANYKNQAQNKYIQASRQYQKNNNPTTNPTTGENPFSENPLEDTNVSGIAKGKVQAEFDESGGTVMTDDEGYGVKYDSNGNIIQTSNPNYVQADNTYYYDIRGVDVPFSVQIRMPSVEMLNRWKANKKATEKGDM